MATYRLTIEFDGTRYHGWQSQQNARTVAGEILRAVQEVVPVVELGGAGRTDAGVHALAQTAHLRLKEAIDPRVLRTRTNERLPPDIHILSVEPAEARFHARHAATARSYLYQVCRRRTAFGKRHVWWVKRPLDADRMREAAERFVGRHDFTLFCERPAEQPSRIVVVERADVVCEGALILVRLVASHFLWKMVRRIVGALVEVGAGQIEPVQIGDLLLNRLPESPEIGTPAEWTAPPSGLFLERVLYEGDPPLPALTAAFPVAAEGAVGARPPRARSTAVRAGARRGIRPPRKRP